MAEDRHVLRSVTDEIMYELMRLSGQEYVDEYAGVAKDRIAAEKRAKVVGDMLGRVERITGRDTSRLSERLFGDDLSPGDYTSWELDSPAEAATPVAGTDVGSADRSDNGERPTAEDVVSDDPVAETGPDGELGRRAG